MDTEGEFVARAKAGSREAFAALVRIHQARVRAYLARHLRIRDLADDLAQEVFFGAYRGLRTFEGDVPFGVWLVGIARNKALACLRAESRRRAREVDRFEQAMAEWRVEYANSEGAVPEMESRRLVALDSCIRKLAPRSQVLVEDRYFKGLSAGEMAGRHGTSENVIRTTLLRIRQALKRCIDGRVSLEGV